MKFHDTPLYTAEQIQRRVAELGAEISTAMAGREVLMLTVLKGAVLFGADLMRHLTVPLRIDFIGARSYCGTCSQGKVEFTYLPQEDCRGRHVLLVEDIIDTGRTAQATTALWEQLEATGLPMRC